MRRLRSAPRSSEPMRMRSFSSALTASRKMLRALVSAAGVAGGCVRLPAR